MINNNETTNVKLTLEQLQQIETVEQKLAGINTQVAVATKNLAVITKDTNRFAREIEAQKELLDSLTPQIDAKKLELSNLKANLTEHTAMLNNVLTEFKKHKDIMESEKMAHKDQEDNLSQKEFELESRESALYESRKSLENEQKTHDEKVAKLKEVISTF